MIAMIEQFLLIPACSLLLCRRENTSEDGTLEHGRDYAGNVEQGELRPGGDFLAPTRSRTDLRWVTKRDFKD